MDKKLQIFNSLEAKNKKGYWLTRSVEERFAYVEELRRLNYGDKACESIQRVLTIVK